MQKSILIAMVILIVLSGCNEQKDTDIQKVANQYIAIASDSYFLSNQRLAIKEHCSDKQETHIFYANNEMELAKVIQYNIENDVMEFVYESKVDIDLDFVLEILSRLNPFDISLKQTSTSTQNNTDEASTITHLLKVENLDENYDKNVRDAKMAADTLALDNKSMNEKIESIHKYILQNCDYDNATDELANRDSFSAYGVFTKHQAVCTGYSRAFMMIAKEANIPSLFVVSEKMNHSWNYAYNGSSWKFIDTTWDDFMIGEGSQKYLKMDANDFMNEGKHEFDDGEYKLLDKLTNEFFNK